MNSQANPDCLKVNDAPDLPPLLPDWRARLRRAINRSGRKHSAVAWDAGIAPRTLSLILNGRMLPNFEIVVRITHAVGETVGWLLGEYGYSLSEQERGRLRAAAATIIDVTAAGRLLRKPRS